MAVEEKKLLADERLVDDNTHQRSLRQEKENSRPITDMANALLPA